MNFLSDLRSNIAPLSLVSAHLASFAINIYIYNYLTSLTPSALLPSWSSFSSGFQAAFITSFLFFLLIAILTFKEHAMNVSSFGSDRYIRYAELFGSIVYCGLTLVGVGLFYVNKLTVKQVSNIYIAFISLSGFNTLINGYLYFRGKPRGTPRGSRSVYPETIMTEAPVMEEELYTFEETPEIGEDED
jgi:hypothetical protein